MTVKSGYGHRVAMVRQETGLNKVSFARGALSRRASSKNIQRIEIEEVTPCAKTLAKIANFAGVNLEWLTYGTASLRSNDIVKVPGVGARIRAARKNYLMTQRGLSQRSKLGESAQNIGRLEKRTHQPRVRTLKRISKALNVPYKKLAFDQ